MKQVVIEDLKAATGAPAITLLSSLFQNQNYTSVKNPLHVML